MSNVLQFLKEGIPVLANADSTACLYMKDLNDLSDQDRQKIAKSSSFHPVPIHLLAEVSDLSKYNLKLHPRVETLLHYNTRPHTFVFDHEDGEKHFRIVRDDALQEIVSEFTDGLFALEANTDNLEELKQELNNLELSTHIECLTIDIKDSEGEPSLRTGFDRKGQLLFDD